MTQTDISELSQRLNGIAAEVTAFALHPRASGEPNRVLAARELGSLKGTVDGLIAHHRSASAGRDKQSATSISSAAEKPMAISAPQSTETKTEAGDSAQVEAQSNPAPPLTQTKKGREFLRMTVLNVATVLLMVVLSLTSTQSLTQMYTAPTAIVMVLIISIQLLIGTSLFL